MKRPLLLILCTLIVAAFQGHLGATVAVSEDVPVPSGTAAFARALGIETIPDRGRFVAELTRLVPSVPTGKNISLAEVLPFLRQQPATDLVPVPLTAELWGEVVFHRPVAAAELLVAILSDRQAALLCRGLAALDNETLEYFATHTAVLASLYERHAAAFGLFAGSLHIRGDRVIPPGGDAAVPLWEAVVRVPVANADRFVVELFRQDAGRTAYLYDTIAQLDPARRAFALGFWMRDSASRLNAMKTLAATWSRALRGWDLRTHLFIRQPYDPSAMLFRVRVDPTGAPTIPNSRAFWSRVLESDTLPDDAARLLKAASDDGPIDAAWLVDAGRGDDEQRLDRLDQVAFGQRMFASSAEMDMPDVFVALRGFPRYRMLMLTLERMGVIRARTYASAVRLAQQLSSLDRGRDVAAITQFQGVVALLQRMVAVGTIDASKAESLVADAIAVPLNPQGRYAGALARWLTQKLRQVIPAADTFEAALLAALSGPNVETASTIHWEGQQYRLDLAAAERKRLSGVRERQGGFPVDVAFEIADLAGRLTSPSVSSTQVESIGRRLKSIGSAFPSTVDATTSHSGVESAAKARDAINLTIRELGAVGNTQGIGRAPRSGGVLGEAADQLTADALISLAYAVNLGYADGAALLAGDLSTRHDFGFGGRDGKTRARMPWALPKRGAAPGASWHVEGSLLGLDVAMAPLGLHQLRADRALEEPTLALEEREAFAASHALMNPFALDDMTRDGIAAAIDAGRRRVSALRVAPSMFDALAEEVGMDGWRRRAVRWTLDREPDRADSMFSLGELVSLGDGTGALNLHAWGMSAVLTSGCLCTEMLPPGRWRSLKGRGELAAATADLNLHVARMLSELGLPARLAKSVLRVAVQDFIDDVRPTDSNDWLTLVRAARAVPREQIEDDLAAATAGGPLVPQIASGP